MKKILSMLMAIAMVFSLIVVPVSAEAEPALAPDVCPAHPEAVWSDFPAIAGGALESGHYKLTGDVALTAALTVAADQTVCIDLAGFDITASASTSNPYRVMENSGTLTILDSAENDGVISGGYMYASSGLGTTYGGNIYNEADSVFNLYGGTISGGTIHRKYHSSTVFGGGNIYSKGTVNIYGGTVTDGLAYGNLAGGAGTTALRRTHLAGGNIYVAGGALTISGGTISNGTVNNIAYGKGAPGAYEAFGGNICASGGTVVTITGGTITGGSVSCNNQGIDSASGTEIKSSAMGGNIHMFSSTTTATISGGTISNGSVEASAVAYGDGTITTTTVSYNGGNISVAAGTFTMSGGEVTGGTANQGGSIYAKGKTTISGGIISGGTAEKLGGNIYVDGTVELTGSTVVTGGTIHTDETSRRGGNIYIASGKTLNMRENVVVKDGVCGPYVTTEVEGESTTTGGKNARGGNIFIAGTFNMYSGTIADGFAGWGNNVMLQSGGAMNMYDGKITGGKAEEHSVLNQRGTVNIYDGEIENAGSNASLMTDGTTATNGGKTYIFGGKLGRVGVNRASVMEITGGSFESFTKSEAGTLTIADGVVASANPADYQTGEATVEVDGKFTTYGKLIDALAAVANTDATVYLAKDMTVEGDLDIYATLDLYGHTLTATGIIDASNSDAAIADSKGAGSATGSDVKLHSGNGMLGIDAENNGVVKYEEVAAKQKMEDKGNGEAFLKFIVDKAAADTLLDEAVLAGSDVQAQITVTSDAITGGSHTFVYDAAMVADYAADWDNKMFTCIITGLDEIGAYTITAEIVSEGVVVAATLAE